jgi:fatty acid synthase subunit alpha
MIIANSLFKIKEARLCSTDMEHRVLFNSMARATLDPKIGSYLCTEKLKTKIAVDSVDVKAVAEMSQILSEARSAAHIG